MLGFLLLGVWTIFIYPKTFVPLKVILSLMFIPSLIVTFFHYKKILTACGYKLYLQDLAYNIIMKILVYVLVTIPIGNIIISVFLLSNFLFADSKSQTYSKKPYNIDKSYSRRSRKNYSHLDIKFNGIEKQINFGSVPTDSISTKIIKLEVSKGLLGYYIIRSRRLENVSKEW